LKLEFILLKNEMLCRSVPFGITSTVGKNVTALQIYARGISIPRLANGDMESANGWTLVRNNGNFSGEIINTTATSPTNSYEISYPQKTLSNPGDYCGISQNFTANDLPAVVLLSFNVKDSYLGDNSGYRLKQALLNRNIVWEDDVAGDERWQHMKIPITLYEQENELTLRVYEENSVKNIPISVWWDDVEIKPISEIKKKPTVEFCISDMKGRDYCPAELHLGASSEFTVVTRNNERFENEYVFQLAIDGEVAKTREFWLNAGDERQYNFSFIPDRVGDLRLEFSLFNRSTHEVLACRSMTASCTIDYENLEPLLRYGIHPLPTIRDGDMRRISAWTLNYNGSFRGSRSTENTSTPYSYCIEQYWDSNEGDYGVLSQDIYASTPGVVVISFNVKDSFESTSEDAKNIIKQVLLNDEIIWQDDISGKDKGYVGWVEEEYVGPLRVWIKYIKDHEGYVEWEEAKYDWWEDEWIKKKVPKVKTGWTHVDIPVYLRKGDNKLRLRVYAKEAVKELSVRVYFDDVEIRPIYDLVKVDERVRVRRYGW